MICPFVNPFEIFPFFFVVVIFLYLCFFLCPCPQGVDKEAMRPVKAVPSESDETTLAMPLPLEVPNDGLIGEEVISNLKFLLLT